MNTAIVTKKVFLENKYINKDYKKHLVEKLKNEKEKCDQEIGYILSVNNDDVNVIKNVVSPDSKGLFFTISYTVNRLKPEINQEYKGVIVMILEDAIFVEIESVLKVVVSMWKHPDYVYKKETFSNGKRTLKVGDPIKVVITLYRYQDSSFNCIGTLKE